MARKKIASRRAKGPGRLQSRKPVVRGRKPLARRSGGVDCVKLYQFCSGLPGATVDLKWGEVIVWSVAKKMFAAFHETEDGGPGLPLGFKCTDEEFDRLTDVPGIIPAPYAAKHGWVSVRDRGAISQKEAERLVGESYRLVVEKLPRRVREGIGQGTEGTGKAKR